MSLSEVFETKRDCVKKLTQKKKKKEAEIFAPGMIMKKYFEKTLA